MLLVEMVTVLFALQFRKQFDLHFDSQMNDWLSEYGQDMSSRSIVDTIQQTFRCCASTNISYSTCCDLAFSQRGLVCGHNVEFKENCTTAVQNVFVK